MADTTLVRRLDTLNHADNSIVGGKNANLGEMLRTLGNKGITVPPGFATTSDAYWEFVNHNKLKDPVASLIGDWQAGHTSLSYAGGKLRKLFQRGRFPSKLEASIRAGYEELCQQVNGDKSKPVSVAVRSSATAEDMPTASFAGQQDSFLLIEGQTALLDAVRRCYASLFNDRAISYRRDQGFDHLRVALSAGIQRMVRADGNGGAAGVMFTIDTESGFDRVVLINASVGLGETVVSGEVNPDEYTAYKPLLNEKGLSPVIGKKRGTKERKLIYGDSHKATRLVPTSRREQDTFVLSDDEITTLARWAVTIEQHYNHAMDIEWSREPSGQLFIVQARFETVQQAKAAAAGTSFTTYHVGKHGKRLTSGLSVGDAAVSGRVILLDSPKQIDDVPKGAIVVAANTDPDWVPIMKRAGALVTDQGGRTSHASIVSRELGLCAVVGTGDATEVLHSGQDISVSCAEGDTGFVYDGHADVSQQTVDLAGLPETRTKVNVNLANPGAAFRWWRLPSDGIGLARMEFVVGNAIQVHPLALVNYDELPEDDTKKTIARLTAAYPHKPDYFVDMLARGFAMLCAVVYPRPAILRLSDFKTNEYAGLIGGSAFEPKEENPMLGFRGASRYYSDHYRAGFALECAAIRKLRNELGFTNAVVMVPFCRTIGEANQVLKTMADNGLERGKNGLKVYVMAELPSNVVLADQFARVFDGFSIGSNDLTQLTLGVDRDSGLLAHLFSEQNDAVKWMLRHVIKAANDSKTPISLCGQAPSDKPDFAGFLVECGINAVSVSPDSFVAVKRNVIEAEKRLGIKA